MNMISSIAHVNSVIVASIPLALPVIETLIRLIPSQKPLSLMHLAAQFFHGLGDLASTVAGGLDAVVPQKLAASAAPAAEAPQA